MISYIKAFFIAVYALIIAILTIIVSPIDQKGRITHQLSKSFSAFILFMAGIKLKVTGKELLDVKENYIFISNHQSYFDIPVLMQAIPNNVRFIYRKNLTKIPVFGWGMYLGQYLPIDRDNPRAAMKELRDYGRSFLKKMSVVIFPEGTRSEDGSIGEFKRGMMILADEAGEVKYVTTTISGTYSIMPKNKFEIKSGEVLVKFEQPQKYTRDKSILASIEAQIRNNLSIK